MSEIRQELKLKHEAMFTAPGNRTPLFQLIIFIYQQTLLKILYEDYYEVSTKF